MGLPFKKKKSHVRLQAGQKWAHLNQVRYLIDAIEQIKPS